MLETGRFLTERQVVHTALSLSVLRRLYFERNKSSFKPAYRKLRSSLYSLFFFFKHINLLFHIVFIFSISLMLPGK